MTIRTVRRRACAVTVKATVAVLVALSLTVLDQAPSSAASAKAPRCSCSSPIAGEKVKVTGALKTRVKRPVQLQQRTSSGAWKKRDAGRTNAKGSYTLKVTVGSKPTVVRVVAPATRVSGKRYARQVSKSLTLRPAKQTVTLSAAAPVGQLADAKSDLRVPVSAVLSPARKGRSVALQRRTASGWTTIGTTKQDKKGRVLFLPRDGMGTVRVVAWKHRGAAKFVGPATKLRTWGAPDFEDTFDGTALDLSKWSYRQVGKRYGLRTKAHSDPGAVSVSNGAVHLKVRKVTAQKPSQGYTSGYTNGHIGTEGRYTFRYGYAAARIKFPKPRGRHGAFWLQSTVGGVVNDPAKGGAEIDIVENYGAGRKDGGSSHGVHWAGKGGKIETRGGILDTRSLLPKGKTWWNSWHVYSVEWTPSKYVFRIDGHTVRTIKAGVSQVPEFLVLSELSSDWELPKLDDSQLPTSVDVDWVRVWQK